MHIVALLDELGRRGCKLHVSRTEDSLKVTPSEALDAELRKSIREHKQDIIQLIRDHEELERTGVLQNELQVRDEFRLRKRGTAA